MSLADDLHHALPPPHPASRPFLLVALALIILGLWLAQWLSWLGLFIVLFCLFFFRDPERIPPDRPGLILAPADGRVASVAMRSLPPELGLGSSLRWRVSIFLSVLNVHVNRVPADGMVTRIAYRHGSFLNASLDKASDTNERNAVALRLADGREIVVIQIAGLIARRIVCTLREGDSVRAGARFGIIRFGSRTDIFLPEGVRPSVSEGQTMLAGETIVAELTV